MYLVSTVHNLKGVGGVHVETVGVEDRYGCLVRKRMDERSVCRGTVVLVPHSIVLPALQLNYLL